MELDIRHVRKELKLPLKALETGFGVNESELEASSRHYLAMRKMAEDSNLDGLAIR